MFIAKIVQTSGMTKENTKFFFFIPECSLSYQEIVQMNDKRKVGNQKDFIIYAVL